MVDSENCKYGRESIKCFLFSLTHNVPGLVITISYTGFQRVRIYYQVKVLDRIEGKNGQLVQNKILGGSVLFHVLYLDLITSGFPSVCTARGM